MHPAYQRLQVTRVILSSIEQTSFFFLSSWFSTEGQTHWICAENERIPENIIKQSKINQTVPQLNHDHQHKLHTAKPVKLAQHPFAVKCLGVQMGCVGNWKGIGTPMIYHTMGKWYAWFMVNLTPHDHKVGNFFGRKSYWVKSICPS